MLKLQREMYQRKFIVELRITSSSPRSTARQADLALRFKIALVAVLTSPRKNSSRLASMNYALRPTLS